MAEDEKPRFDPAEAQAPTHMDGTPVDKEEAARVHAGLVSGEIDVKIAPEALADMERLGISIDDLRKSLIAGTKKTMN